MKREVFPLSFVKSTVSHYTFHTSRYSISIYNVIMWFLIFGLASLPFVNVEVTRKGQGVISAEHGKIAFYSPVGARVKNIRIQENSFVKPGDTLLVFDHSITQNRLDQRISYTTQLSDQIHDYHLILTFSNDGEALITKFRTPEVKQLFMEYLRRYKLMKSELLNAQKNFDRQRQLFEQKVVSEREFEKDKLGLDQALGNLALSENQYKNLWQDQRLKLQNEQNEVEMEIATIKEQLGKHFVVSSTEGNIKNLEALGRNQYFQHGQKLLDITPMSQLYALCYVRPEDIGMLQIGQKVKLSVDAYDFNDWGFVEGLIEDISADAYYQNEQAFFIVKCSLKNDQVSLSNGFSSQLRKGMTFTANFHITRRSLMQLIFDKADDWYNPNVI